MNENVHEMHDERDKLSCIATVLDIPQEMVEEQREYLYTIDRSFKILWDLFSHLNDFTVVTEEHYIDRVYRDSYYFYYASKHFDYNRYCKRLFLFDCLFQEDFSDISPEFLEERFIGSVVIRPIMNRSIGRTLLSPRYFLDKSPCYIRLADYSVTVYGKRLKIRGFPYSMQDGETTSCAEITILNILDYYSQTYPEYRYLLPSDINHIAESNSYERRLPTIGLRYELISKIFSEVGFHPRLYSSQKMSARKLKRIMHYYIESGIPVALGLKVDTANKHSIICIGHGPVEYDRIAARMNGVMDAVSGETLWISDAADAITQYCIMDDNLEPYKICVCEERIERQGSNTRKIVTINNFEAEYLMVPLYKRMFLEAADAYDICTSILAHHGLGVKNFSETIGKRENPVIVRLFMASSRTFRKVRNSQFQNDNKELRDFYNEAFYPKFVWVCEIYDRTHYPKEVIGEIIVDATASPEMKANSAIIIHYPKMICIRGTDALQKGTQFEFREIVDWKLFKPYDGNLSPFTDSESIQKSSI